MKQIVYAACIALAFATGAQAKNNRIDSSLDHLDPTTRLEQLCAIEAMTRVKKDGKPYRPDRAITYALSKPVLSGHTMSGQGGAFPQQGQMVPVFLHLQRHRRPHEGLHLHLQDRRSDPGRSVGNLRALPLTHAQRL